jgi:hypothetical protein
MSITAYRDYVSDLEPKLHDLVHATTIACNLVDNMVGRTPVGTGSPTLYRITDDEANRAIYALGEAISKAKGLQKEWSTFVSSANDPLEGRAADVVVTDRHSAVRVAWRHAMAEFAPGLDFCDMYRAYEALKAVGDALLDVMTCLNCNGAGHDLIEAIQDDVSSIRAEIGDYCVKAASGEASEDTLEQRSCDIVALQELALDPNGNAEEIAAIAARLLAAKSNKAQPVTAEAA